jgi:hypothetical protein
MNDYRQAYRENNSSERFQRLPESTKFDLGIIYKCLLFRKIHGKLSVPYIMKKFRITHSKASELYSRVERSKISS